MKGGKVVFLNQLGEEVPKGDPSAVSRFDTNKYEKLPLGGRRGKKTRRRRRGGAYSREAIQEILQLLRGALLSASLDQRKDSLRQGLLRMEPVVGPNPARITPAEVSALTTSSAVEDASAALRLELYASSAYRTARAPTLTDPEHPGPDGPSPSPSRPLNAAAPPFVPGANAPQGGRRRMTRRRRRGGSQSKADLDAIGRILGSVSDIPSPAAKKEHLLRARALMETQLGPNPTRMTAEQISGLPDNADALNLAATRLLTELYYSPTYQTSTRSPLGVENDPGGVGGRRRTTRRRRRGGAYSKPALVEIELMLRTVAARRATPLPELEARQLLLEARARMETQLGPSQFGRRTAEEISALPAGALRDAALELETELINSVQYQTAPMPTLTDPEHPGVAAPAPAPAPLTVTARAPLGPSPRRSRVLNPEDDTPPSSPQGGRRRTTRRRS